MGSKRIGLARVEALMENLKREIDLSSSTIRGLNAVVAAEADTHGAGFVSTEVAPSTYISKLANGDILTTIDIDLTGLKKVSDDGDAIGLDGIADASMLTYSLSKHGIPYRIELTCLELPTGTNVLLDFDIMAINAALAYNGDVAGAGGSVTLLTGGGNIAKGQTMTNETLPAVADGQFLHLVEGATSTNAQLFTAGKLTVRLYGRPSF
jgi:hypothetical protein